MVYSDKRNKEFLKLKLILNQIKGEYAPVLNYYHLISSKYQDKIELEEEHPNEALAKEIVSNDC